MKTHENQRIKPTPKTDESIQNGRTNTPMNKINKHWEKHFGKKTWHKTWKTKKNQENHGVHFGADQNEMQTSDPVFATGTCEQGPPRHGPPNDLGNPKPPKTTFWNKSAFFKPPCHLSWVFSVCFSYLCCANFVFSVFYPRSCIQFYRVLLVCSCSFFLLVLVAHIQTCFHVSSPTCWFLHVSHPKYSKHVVLFWCRNILTNEAISSIIYNSHQFVFFVLRIYHCICNDKIEIAFFWWFCPKNSKNVKLHFWGFWSRTSVILHYQREKRPVGGRELSTV